MDATSIAFAIVGIDEELALLSKRRQLLVDLAATFAPPAPAVVSPTPLRALPAPKPKPATPKPTRATPKTAPSTKVDYNEVAVVIKRAQAAGKPVKQALAEHFDKPISTVKNWVVACRNLGLLREEPRTGPKPVERPMFSTEEVRDIIEGNAS